MSLVVPAYLPAYVLIGSIAAITAVLVAVYRGLVAVPFRCRSLCLSFPKGICVSLESPKPHLEENRSKGAVWPDRERRKAIWSVAALLIVWFLAELIPAWLGFFQGASPRIPMIQYGMLVPPVLIAVLFWRWPLLRRVVEAVPQKWIVGVQFYRVEGLIFLVLYAAGKLPGVFALPAGIGDVITGIFALIVGAAYARNPQASAGRVRAWNLFGIADLVVAISTGFLTSPSPLQMLSLDKPNELITAFPLVMVPVYLVPLAILLHVASLKKIRQAATAKAAGTLDGLAVLPE